MLNSNRKYLEALSNNDRDPNGEKKVEILIENKKQIIRSKNPMLMRQICQVVEAVYSYNRRG